MVQEPSAVAAKEARSPKSGKAAKFAAAVTFVSLSAAIVWSIAAWMPPSPEPLGAPAEEFAALRAEKFVADFATSPRPIGSPQWARTRQYIEDQLQSFGVASAVEPGVAVVGKDAAFVQNIVATIPGMDSGPGILLVAHYDTVPNSPGAADDGMGVACLLETARAIKSGKPTRKSITLLFSDGEEEGLLGARAFAAAHDMRQIAQVVINLDARGSAGPAVMFETGADTAGLLQQFAVTVPRPVANSLMPEAYKLLGNDTDFTIFKKAGLAGFNFAVIDGVLTYHTGHDRVASLNKRSLQHMGASMLALTRLFASESGPIHPSVARTYFNVGPWLAIYSTAWDLPLAVLAVVLSICGIVLGIVTRRISGLGLLLGLAAFPIASILVSVVTTLAWGLELLANRSYRWLPYGATYNDWLYRIAATALIIGGLALINEWLLRRTQVANLWAGVLITVSLLGLLLALRAPGASYAVVWPALFGGAALIALVTARDKSSWGTRVPVLISGVVAILLIVPLSRMLFWTFESGFLTPPAIFIAILFGLLLPEFELFTTWRRYSIAASAAAVFVISIAAAEWQPPPRSAPLPSDLFYSENANSRKGAWVNTAQREDDWNRNMLGSHPEQTACEQFEPGRPGKCLIGEAAYSNLLAPSIQVLSQESEGESRYLRLRLSSARHGAESAVVFEQGAIISAELDGRPFVLSRGNENGPVILRFLAPPDGIVDFSCQTKTQRPVHVRIYDRSYGLHEAPGYVSRPDNLMAVSRDSDSFFVIRNAVL